MNRRKFLSVTLGSAAAATIPMPALSGAAAPARPAVYAWAVAMTHAQARVSEAALVSQLGITRDTARATMARLLERGLIEAPDAGGVARAVAPMLRSVPLPGLRTVASASQGLQAKADVRINDLLNRPDPVSGATGTPEQKGAAEATPETRAEIAAPDQA